MNIRLHIVDTREEVKQMVKNRRSKGQSTLEYILVLAAIIVAIIAATNTLVRPAINTAMTDSSNVITGATNRLQTGLGLGN